MQKVFHTKINGKRLLQKNLTQIAEQEQMEFVYGNDSDSLK